MANSRIANSLIKGLIMSGTAVTLTLLFHGLVMPTSDLPYVLLAVITGSFISAFFAEYTGHIVCEDEEEHTRGQYIALGSLFFVLGVTNVMDNKIASAGWVIASLLLAVAAYIELDKSIRKIVKTTIN